MNAPVWGKQVDVTGFWSFSLASHSFSSFERLIFIYIKRPPVHSIQVPVIYDDSGLARKSITRAASSAEPGRPSGISETSRHFFAFSGIPSLMAWPPTSNVSDLVGGRVMRVSIQP